MKGGTSPVSEADYAVDRYLRETLTAARPAYGWLSEETADDAGRLAARRTFVVDPIDGTRAFLDGQLDLVRQHRRRRGRASAGRRARLPGDGRDLFGAPRRRRREERSADPSRRAARTGPDRRPASRCSMRPLPTSNRASSRAPYVPSLAYRIAMVAEGALDATFIKPNSHDWDLAAADLILAEAGGRLLRADRRSGRSMPPPIRATARLRPAAGRCCRAMVAAIAAMSAPIA